VKKAPILDTHIWLWWMLGDPRLSSQEMESLDAFPLEDRPAISEISLWEAAMLVDLGRLRLTIPLADFFTEATHRSTVQRIGITPEIVVQMNELPETFHRDPADRLITATALQMQRSLATRDARIQSLPAVSVWKVL